MGARGGGSGAPLISPSIGHFIGGPESVKIIGVPGVLCIWQLVFASCHRLKSNNKNNNNKKGCLMVMANHLDLDHGKNHLLTLESLSNSSVSKGVGVKLNPG